MPAVLDSLGAGYAARRGRVQEYFDRTAAGAWARLTGDAPVSGVRATVREGRARMRAQLLAWLPEDLAGARVLDAGCGPGMLAMELAARGAAVTAVDLSPTLVALARERAAGRPGADRVVWHVGDMLDPALGRHDYVVAMDSLLYYDAAATARSLGVFAAAVSRAVLATFAPATPLLRAMHATGRLFPRADRAPAIEPVGEGALRAAVRGMVGDDPRLAGWRWARSARVAHGFYTSQALELRHDDSSDPALETVA
ncbi:magnesium protoporphyrin IX methyltransferase [Gemmatimonadetes bacterium T265]|nr:magnesium protoporphyrin IX methyltransferase [Gemmatimonadetes bacterium T265]